MCHDLCLHYLFFVLILFFLIFYSYVCIKILRYFSFSFDIFYTYFFYFQCISFLLAFIKYWGRVVCLSNNLKIILKNKNNIEEKPKNSRKLLQKYRKFVLYFKFKIMKWFLNSFTKKYIHIQCFKKKNIGLRHAKEKVMSNM